MAVSSSASTSRRWTPGSSRSSRSHPSPTVPLPKSPDWSPTTTTATSQSRGGGHGVGEAREVVVVDRAPRRERDLRVGPLGRERGPDRRREDARGRARVLGEDVVDEGVAAEERLEPVRVRADDGHADGSQHREGPVVAQQDDRLLGQAGGHPAVLGVVEVDLGGRAVLEGRVEQAELLLLGERTQHRAVDQRARRCDPRAPRRRAARGRRRPWAARCPHRPRGRARPPHRGRRRRGGGGGGTRRRSSRRPGCRRSPTGRAARP